MSEQPKSPPGGLPQGFNLSAHIEEAADFNPRQVVLGADAEEDMMLPHAAAAAQRLFKQHQELHQRTHAQNEQISQLTVQANRDPLTGLANRRMLHDRFDYLRATAHHPDRRKGEPARAASLLVVDLDNLKPINDMGGHSAGDEVLIKLAEILSKNVRRDDTAARIGGDEFAVLLSGITPERATEVAEAIRQEMHDLTSATASIGIGSVDFDDVEGLDSAMERADKALYAAKESGKNIVVNFDQLGKP